LEGVLGRFWVFFQPPLTFGDIGVPGVQKIDN